MGDIGEKGVFSKSFPLPLAPWNAPGNVSETDQWALLERVAEQLPHADTWKRLESDGFGCTLLSEGPEGTTQLALLRTRERTWELFFIQRSAAFRRRRRRYGRLGFTVWWLSSLAFTVLLTWHLRPLPLARGVSLFIFVGVAAVLWLGAMVLTMQFRVLTGPRYVVPPSALAMAEALGRVVSTLNDADGS